MSILYTSNGKDVTHGSYSSRQTFRHCPRSFQLTRIEGWSEKVERAALHFGKCVEGAIQGFEGRNREAGRGVLAFEQLWSYVKLLPEFEKLVYTRTEGDFDSLLRAGREMLQLYEVMAPKLPIVLPQFQVRVDKTIFPHSNLDNLTNTAYLDILSNPPWNHPLLPKIELLPEFLSQPQPMSQPQSESEPEPRSEPESQSKPQPQPQPMRGLGFPRPLVIDIKTSGVELDTDLVALDPQLLEYSWQTRIPDVGFLWFTKHDHGLKRGSRVTMLDSGDECFVLEVNDPVDGDVPVYVGSRAALQTFEAAIVGLRGKARNERMIAELAKDGISLVSSKLLTKQRLVFAAARFSEEDMNEVGRSVAQTTVEMVRAHEQGFYERQSSIRFPNQKCQFCALKWICLNRPKERDENLTRKGEEWMDGNYDLD